MDAISYWVLLWVPWVLLLVSFFSKSKGSRMSLQILALIMFSVLSISGTSVEHELCSFTETSEVLDPPSNTTTFYYGFTCQENPDYHEGEIWIHAGMAIVSGIFAFITGIQHFDNEDE